MNHRAERCSANGMACEGCGKELTRHCLLYRHACVPTGGRLTSWLLKKLRKYEQHCDKNPCKQWCDKSPCNEWRCAMTSTHTW